MLYSIETGRDTRITTRDNLEEAIKYAKLDEDAKEIFEFNDEDTEIIGGCVWTKSV